METEEKQSEQTTEGENYNINLGSEGENRKEASESGNDKLKFIAFFVVAFLVGVVIKTQASNFFEVGYDDPKLDDWKSDFNTEETMEAEEDSQKGEATENEQQNNDEGADAIEAGGTCGG